MRSDRIVALLALLAAPLPSAAGRAASQKRPAIERLANTFADEVRVVRGSGDPAIVAVVFTAGGDEGDVAAGGELGRLVERLLLGRLTTRAGFTHATSISVTDHDTALDVARLARAGRLLEVQLHRVGGELILSGTLTPTWRNFWTGEIDGEPQAVVARVRADRAALLLARASTTAAPTGGMLQLRPLIQLTGEVVAVAVGDVDNDGRLDIAALTGVALTVLRLDGASVTILATRPLTDRPRAAAPARDPTGGVVIAQIALRPAIAYHHSSLAEGEILHLRRHTLEHLASLSEVPLDAADGAILYANLLPGQSLFRGALRVVRSDGEVLRFDAGTSIRHASLLPDPGQILFIDGAHSLRRTTVRRKRGAARLGAAEGRVGSGLAVVDLDGDGIMERVGSSAHPPSDQDQLVIATLGGEVRELRPIPGAIRALAVGDATGDGKDDVVIAASGGDGSWLYLLSEDRP